MTGGSGRTCVVLSAKPRCGASVTSFKNTMDFEVALGVPEAKKRVSAPVQSFPVNSLAVSKCCSCNGNNLVRSRVESGIAWNWKSALCWPMVANAASRQVAWKLRYRWHWALNTSRRSASKALRNMTSQNQCASKLWCDAWQGLLWETVLCHITNSLPIGGATFVCLTDVNDNSPQQTLVHFSTHLDCLECG